MTLRLLIERLLYSSSPGEGFLKRVFLFPLYLISLLYGLIIRLRHTLYSNGLFQSSSLACRVVSVGNITLGGTGKTPTVIHLAQLFQSRGLKTVVLSRGYRSQSPGPVAVVSDGKRILLNAREAGDEPVLLAKALPGVPVIIGGHRVLSGRLAREQFSPDIIVLDDGFQHLQLKRDADIVLIDQGFGFGNGCLIPRGILREPLSALKRADIVILSKKMGENHNHTTEQVIAARNPRAPVFSARYAIKGLTALDGAPAADLRELKGKRVLALAGIGNPHYFTYLLRTHGIPVTEELILPDHHHYTAADARRLAAYLRRVDCIITTAKDGCKMEGESFKHLPILMLEVMLEIDGEQAFSDALFKCISERG